MKRTQNILKKRSSTSSTLKVSQRDKENKRFESGFSPSESSKKLL
jgi:hypothetical protein